MTARPETKPKVRKKRDLRRVNFSWLEAAMEDPELRERAKMLIRRIEGVNNTIPSDEILLAHNR